MTNSQTEGAITRKFVRERHIETRGGGIHRETEREIARGRALERVLTLIFSE